ncbi:ZFP27 protein, partial [Menura novaehollandiae]|nr:ZFP27 protein [Menura novaehollandiae]
QCRDWGPLSHTDPDSKFTHMKEESHEGVPCAGGDSGAPDTTGIRDDTLFPTGARGSFASEDDDRGHWELGYGAPCSSWRETEPGGCARTLPREVPAGSGLLICGTRGLSFGAGAALRAHLDEPPHLGPPYLCGTCGKSFRHRRNLLTHKKLRGGARARHGCAECGRTFCLRGDLLRHRDTHR